MHKQAYVDAGYESRKDYLIGLAEEHGVEINTVLTLAALLGPEEDFDGLVSSVQDAEFLRLGE